MGGIRSPAGETGGGRNEPRMPRGVPRHPESMGAGTVFELRTAESQSKDRGLNRGATDGDRQERDESIGVPAIETPETVTRAVPSGAEALGRGRSLPSWGERRMPPQPVTDEDATSGDVGFHVPASLDRVDPGRNGGGKPPDADRTHGIGQVDGGAPTGSTGGAG